MSTTYRNAPPGPNLPVFTVSQLTAQIKELLETAFPVLWVSGEMSNFSRPGSGHSYFTLKDDAAQIRAVLWRSDAVRVRFDLHDGLEVLCQGYLELYAPRGTYQFVVRQIQPKGLGALELALRQLREKLAAEGLFDPRRKRPLPRFPRRVAVVTSPTGAALQDFLEVLHRRWRGCDVLVVPTRVQGEGAGAEVAAAIARANRLTLPIDCLIVARGGGSLEDLWAFNEEAVVRAICASRIPVISAVGHDIDVTLSDLAADVRALTPSEAAELVVPAADEVRQSVLRFRQRLLHALERRAQLAGARLDALAARRIFRRPLERIHDLSRRLDELDLRARRGLEHRLKLARSHADALAGQLDSLSPLAVLARGYSLTRRLSDGQLVRDATELNVGAAIITRFDRGETVSRVEELRKSSEI